jgi:hypothetical protein
MAEVNLKRAAKINWTVLAGDTFAPGPVSFTIDGVAESFAGATLKMEIRKGIVVHTLTNGSGITVAGNQLQYVISAADMVDKLPAGSYSYDVQKTVSGVVSTIQEGLIIVKKDVTA